MKDRLAALRRRRQEFVVGLHAGPGILVPAIDDLDPFGGAYGGAPKYFMTLAVIPELAADLHAH